jgi:hypothetical protein
VMQCAVESWKLLCCFLGSGMTEEQRAGPIHSISVVYLDSRLPSTRCSVHVGL